MPSGDRDAHFPPLASILLLQPLAAAQPPPPPDEYDMLADPNATVRDLTVCAAYYGQLSKRATEEQADVNDFAFKIGRRYLRAASVFATFYMSPELATQTTTEIFDTELARQRVLANIKSDYEANDSKMTAFCKPLDDVAAAIEEWARRKRFEGAADLPPN